MKHFCYDIIAVRTALQEASKNPIITNPNSEVNIFLPSSINSINYNRLNLHCLTLNCDYVESLQDFIKFANKIHPTRQIEIQNF